MRKEESDHFQACSASSPHESSITDLVSGVYWVTVIQELPHGLDVASVCRSNRVIRKCFKRNSALAGESVAPMLHNVGERRDESSM
jgi:hypothetical protein